MHQDIIFSFYDIVFYFEIQIILKLKLTTDLSCIGNSFQFIILNLMISIRGLTQLEISDLF